MDISTPDLCGPLMFCVNGDGNYSCECLAGTLLMDGVCEAGKCMLAFNFQKRTLYCQKLAVSR